MQKAAREKMSLSQILYTKTDKKSTLSPRGAIFRHFTTKIKYSVFVFVGK